MPFTLETLDFLSLNRAMNSREWFHAHRAEYESLVLEPLAELTLALAPALADIDPAIVCDPRVGKSISRIWRDTRRGPDLPIYRDVMWCIFLREKYAALPGFWFEFSPLALRWGCGWYQTPPEVMDAARTLIRENGPPGKRRKKPRSPARTSPWRTRATSARATRTRRRTTGSGSTSAASA